MVSPARRSGPIAPAGIIRGASARPRVWRIPAVLFAIALISVTFFGEGALESFLSTYLQTTMAGGVLVSALSGRSKMFSGRAGRLPRHRAIRYQP